MVNQEILMVSKQDNSFSQEEVIELFNNSDSLDEIAKFVENAEDRLYTTWATVDAKDNEGQVVPIDEAIKQQAILMNRDAPIQDTHTNKNVGKTLAFRVLEHPESKTIGILQLNKIYNDNVLDDKVWTETVSGKRKGSSVGGFSTDKQKVMGTDGMFEELKGFNWMETSNVEKPCNPFATNHSMSLIAKSEKMDEVKKEDQDMATETPEVSSEDRLGALEEAVSIIASKVEEMLSATAGTPEVEKEAEEETTEEKEVEKEEDSTEEEKEEEVEKEDEETKDEESDVAKSLKSIKSEMSELKKLYHQNKIVEVVKSEMPETKVEVSKSAHTFSDVMKGKVSMETFRGQ